jgi:GAF domain-containing protein
VVSSEHPLVVRNAHDDPLVRDNLAIMDLGVVAYVGVPLRQGTGPVVGAVCAIDHRPRDWSDVQVKLLSELADDVSAALGEAASAG